MFEKIERAARTLLWICLSLIFVAVPVSISKSHTADATTQLELKKAEDKIAELSKPREPERFPVKSLGMYLAGVASNTSEGGMTFTNTTAKGGDLGLKGRVVNVKAGASTDSIAACKEVKPFDSMATLTFKFPSSTLHQLCPQESDCSFSVVEIEKQTGVPAP